MSDSLKQMAIDVENDVVLKKIDVQDVPKKAKMGESLSETMKQMEADELMHMHGKQKPPGLLKHPELPQDYIRNFLIRKNMTKALQAFQAEWYEMDWKDPNFTDNADEAVPDCYLEIAHLERKVAHLENELSQQSNQSSTTATASTKLAKERDYHRLCHRQIKQDLREMQNEIARLHAHYAGLEEKAATIKHRYERSQVAKTTALNELKKSRKDIDDVVALSETVLQLSQDTLTETHTESSLDVMMPPPTAPDSLRSSNTTAGNDFNDNHTNTNTANLDSAMPEYPTSLWPHFDTSSSTDLSVLENLSLTSTFRAHDAGVSAVAVDPTSKVLATASDDGWFKTWEVSTGELLLSSQGHDTWVGACKFHPTGALAATASGDGTVKVWNLDEGCEKATLFGHRYAIWDIAFHCGGDFIASASLDGLVKIWDLASQRCRKTLHGHTESVNSVDFQTSSNVCISAGVDKNCILWDIRTGLKIRTLQGHKNSLNHAIFSPSSERAASIDADGVVKLWELRTGSELASLAPSGVAANKCSFDASGNVLAVARDDRTVKLYDANSLAEISTLQAHSDAVQGIAFASSTLVSGGADGTVRMWT